MHSDKATNLQLPLPPSATDTNIVPGINTNLTSLGQLCDAGCTAHFNKNTVTIKHGNKIVTTGYRDPTTKLWMIQTAYHNNATANTNNKAHANNAWHTTTKRELIEFLHQCAGCPTVCLLYTSDAADE